MSANIMNIILRNNTGNQGKERLIEGFVIRLKLFNNLLNEIKSSEGNKPEQNYVIIGQRGAGKTTILFRLKYAIEDDAELRDTILPIMLNEEQYHLTDLIDLWETIGDHLSEFPAFPGIIDKIKQVIVGGRYDEEKVYEVIEQALLKTEKKIVLFIENLDTMLKKFGREGQQRLREVLTTSRTIRIIGSATTHFDAIISYSEPFYDFFKIIQLSGLTQQETFKLLLKIAQQSNEVHKIESLLRYRPTRVEALRRLTGGNPRMISYLYQIFLDNANGSAIKDLYKLLDDLTFLYKSEMDQLSAQQQKVVDIIARNWDAISVKELVVATRMESKHISSVLSTLEKNQFIERVNTKTKNNLYRLKDRFLNIWYLMRFGKKKEKEDIVWLVKFYDTWCNKNELSERVLHLIDNLLGGHYDKVAAIEMVNTFLNVKNARGRDKYKLYKTSKSTLPKELVRDLKLSQKDWFDTIKDLVKRKQFDHAIDVLEEMGDNGINYHFFSYWIYANKPDYPKAFANLEWIYNEKQDAETAFRLAEMAEVPLNDYDKAIDYYQIALDKGRLDAAFRLGQVYFFFKHEEKKAISYYEQAVNHDQVNAIMPLATIYFSNGNFERAKTMCLLAIEKGIDIAYLNLSILFQQEGNIEEAIHALEKAIALNVDEALVSLAELYLSSTKGNDEKAKKLFELAVEKGVTDAYHALGKYLLHNEKDTRSAIKILNEGMKHDYGDCAHLLAHYYQETHEFDKAQRLFIKSFDAGKRTALFCLANSAFYDRLESKKQEILHLFESKVAPFKEPLSMIEYCKLLVWNDRFQESRSLLLDQEPKIASIFDGDYESYKEEIISEITEYFIRLIAKKQYQLVSQLFLSDGIDYRQKLKPVYFAFMRYLKEDYPTEYLKAGAEMDETINEIVGKIEKVRELTS
jgi:TPR repeat protein/Fe2+ or Zn2+ uptake regulation protein